MISLLLKCESLIVFSRILMKSKEMSIGHHFDKHVWKSMKECSRYNACILSNKRGVCKIIKKANKHRRTQNGCKDLSLARFLIYHKNKAYEQECVGFLCAQLLIRANIDISEGAVVSMTELAIFGVINFIAFSLR